MHARLRGRSRCVVLRIGHPPGARDILAGLRGIRGVADSAAGAVRPAS